MTQYNLQALLKIREHKKDAAERVLENAVLKHQLEQKKLLQIEECLRDAITARTERHNNFFQKAQQCPSTKTEIVCHIASNQKTMCDEIGLRKARAEQEEMVRSASRGVDVARNAAIDAHRNLKVIEKHHASWQRMLQRAEEMKEEYANDDQNAVRFLLKKA